MVVTIVKENETINLIWVINFNGSQILFQDNKIKNIDKWKKIYESIQNGTPYELCHETYDIRCAGKNFNGTLYFADKYVNVYTPITQEILNDLKIISEYLF